jgi:ketol-acid reductoisomerase
MHAVPSSASRDVAVLGFGHQGEAQAQNLRDSGWRVTVGARPDHSSAERARRLGFAPRGLTEAAANAGCVALMLPDELLPQLWASIAPVLREDVTLVFAHGFNLLYSNLEFPPGADVVLVSPTGPGRVLREHAALGEKLPAYIAVHRDASGHALASAEGYAAAIGCAPLWRTTVREETEVDLFGEQTVLCGGMNALVTAAFETLVEAGFAPEIAYLECVHQLKYLADLLHERGVAGLRRSISGTALYGDLSVGEKVVGASGRAAMRESLAEIRSGAFAEAWLAESAGGRSWLSPRVLAADAHPMERARRRALGLPEPPSAEP